MKLSKNETRQRRKVRIRKKIQGTVSRPRLVVYRSNLHIYAQLVDDAAGRTLAATSTLSLKKTEAAGFDINQISTKPMTMVPLLFWGAFQWHHKNIKQDVTDKILFDDLGGLTEEELGHLGELFSVPFDTLVAQEEEGMVVNPRKATVKF